jgi:dTDP-glucose 4,6-dehydratase
MNFVADTVRGFLLAARTPDIEGLTLNLGSGVGVSMAELTERIFRVVGLRPEVEQQAERTRPNRSEVFELLADASLAEARLGWRSQVDLDEGLRTTVQWIAEHRDLYKTHIYNL